MRFLAICLTLLVPLLTLSAADQKIYSYADASLKKELADAIDLYNDGQVQPEDYDVTRRVFEKFAQAGDPVGQYYYGHIHHYARGVDQDYATAWNYYHKAAEQGVAEAYGRLGLMQQVGIGRPKNTEDAERLYRNAIPLDPQALNNLGNLLRNKKDPISQAEGYEMLRQAASLGNDTAQNTLGFLHCFGRIAELDLDFGLAQLKKSKAQGNLRAHQNLLNIARGNSLLPKQSEAVIDEALKDLKQRQKEITSAYLAEVMYAYEQGGIDAGLRKLDAKSTLMSDYTLWRFHFCRSLWWEAQTKSGEEDLEWGWRLFEWIYQNDKERHIKHRWKGYFPSILLGNLANTQAADGRIGLLPETGRKYAEGFINKHNISLDWSPEEDFHHGLPKLPRYDRFNKPVIQPKTSDYKFNRKAAGKFIELGSIGNLSVLSDIEWYQGNWRKALAYTHWVDKWIQSVKENGDSKLMEHRDFGQYAHANAFNRKTIYDLLGFREMALSQLDHVIENRSHHYGSRKYYNALTQRAASRASYGMPIIQSTAKLIELRKIRANNKFEQKSARYAVDLAIAEKLRQDGNFQEAYELINQLIHSAEEEGGRIPKSRAMKIRIRWNFADNRYKDCEDDLVELISNQRSKGLIMYEPELYHIYAQVKAAQGTIKKAIELQLTSIELYKSIDLYTWLPLRFIELASWYQQIGEYSRARYYANRARDLLNQPEAQYPAWLAIKTTRLLEMFELENERRLALETIATVDPTEAEVTTAEASLNSNLDLAPKQIVSVPLDSMPALGIFSVTNLSEQNQPATLEGFGRVESIARNAEGDLNIQLSPDSNLEEHRFELEVDATSQQLIYVTAPTDAAPLNLKLLLTEPGHVPIEAEFRYLEIDSETPVAVINASEVENNPYYMLSIFHVLQRKKSSERDICNLRFVASANTRIEAYSDDGNLLFVDADGDGAFTSSGDVLRADTDANNFADVTFAPGSDTKSIEIMLSPIEQPEDGILKIEVQRLSEGVWKTDAVDLLRF